jgi:hypothetical protein
VPDDDASGHCAKSGTLIVLPEQDHAVGFMLVPCIQFPVPHIHTKLLMYPDCKKTLRPFTVTLVREYALPLSVKPVHPRDDVPLLVDTKHDGVLLDGHVAITMIFVTRVPEHGKLDGLWRALPWESTRVSVSQYPWLIEEGSSHCQRNALSVQFARTLSDDTSECRQRFGVARKRTGGGGRPANVHGLVDRNACVAGVAGCLRRVARGLIEVEGVQPVRRNSGTDKRPWAREGVREREEESATEGRGRRHSSL